MRLAKMVAAAVMTLVAVGVGACDKPAETAPTKEKPPITYVALGDSWPAGAHCNGCRTFVGRYADLLETQGTPVQFIDLTQAAQPNGQGQTPASLLKDLRSSEEMREAVAGADLVVMSTGPNDLDSVLSRVTSEECGGRDNLECIRRTGAAWQSSFDKMLTEMEELRDGKSTAIRLVTAGDSLSFDIGFATTYRAFVPKGSELFFAELRDAMCKAAADHEARCVDVRPIINGPKLDRYVDENKLETHQAIADLLLDTGLEELRR